MSDDQISELGYTLWDNGLRCKASDTTGCPRVHDNLLRKDSPEKKRPESRKKKKGQKWAASRSQPQEQYNIILATKPPNIQTPNLAKEPTSAKVDSTAEVNSRIESVMKQIGTQVQHSTTATFNADIISSMVEKINNLKVDHVAVTKFETVHRLSWATVIYSKPNARLASKFPKPNHSVCRKFLAGSCQRGVNCRYSHLVPSPTNPQVPWPGIKNDKFEVEFEICLDETVMPPRPCRRRKCPPPKYSWDVYNKNAPIEDQQPYATYPSPVSQTPVVSHSSPPKAQHSKANLQASTGTLDQVCFDSSENPWDTTRRSSTTKAQLSDADQWALETQRLKPKLVLPPPADKAPDSATFHRFQELPVELRIKIWKIAMKDYRNTARVVWRWDDRHMGDYYRSRLEPRTRPPPFLHVSKQVRDIAGHYHFERAFGTEQAAAETWFNFENDRLFLQTSSPLQLVKMAAQIIPRERKLVSYLALPLRDFVHNPTGFVSVVTSFHSLEHLHLFASAAWEDRHWTCDPRMIRKIKAAIKKDWIRRQTKYRPDDMLEVPGVWIESVNPDVAKVYEVDGIQWGVNARHTERLWLGN
jgi:2EXR family/Zinc finger C-x8-C-x5-C-x3-H type (and similar)